LPTAGLDLAPGAIAELLSVDENDWRAELPLIEEHYAVFGDHLPTTLHDELDHLAKRLANKTE
jgi:phosphoenolpyruvate carboxykinase (GTP)